MPETYLEFIEWEVAFITIDRPRNESKEGDICGVRAPSGRIGRLEHLIYVHLLLEGLDSYEMRKLQDSLWELEPPPETPEERGEMLYRHRYSIPLDRLAEVEPSFDRGAASDRGRNYQPFLNVEADDVFHRMGGERRVGKETNGTLSLPRDYAGKPALSVFGLVFDKKTMDYL